MPDRFPSAGLAHSAADRLTEQTGQRHEMAFRPRGRFVGSFDPQPFVVVKTA
jgi:hypothetical protein